MAILSKNHLCKGTMSQNYKQLEATESQPTACGMLIHTLQWSLFTCLLDDFWMEPSFLYELFYSSMNFTLFLQVCIHWACLLVCSFS